jgi:hypothetical protein
MAASHKASRGRFWITLALVTTYIFDLTGLERLAVHAWPAVLIVQPCGVLLFLAWLLRYGSREEMWSSEAFEPAVSPQAEEESLAEEEPLIPLPVLLPGPWRGADSSLARPGDPQRRAA